MKKILISLFTLLLFVPVFAQTEVFRVLITKGDNKYTAATGSSPAGILVGTKLPSTASITVAPAGYLALAHVASGKTIEVKAAGTYTISKLVEQVSVQNASVSSKYMNYVTGQMASGGNQDLNANRQKYMSVTGSVERGGDSILLYAEKKNYVLSEKVGIAWSVNKQYKTKEVTYVVRVKDIYDDMIDSLVTSDTSAVLDLSKYKLEKEFQLFVEVRAIQYPALQSENYLLVNISPEKRASIESEYSKLKNEVDPSSPIGKLVCASYLAEQGLVLNAMANYQDAIKAQPEVSEFKQAYTDYLSQVGMFSMLETLRKGKKK